MTDIDVDQEVWEPAGPIDGLTQHVRRSQHRILGRQEEAALARRARAGDKAAFDTLVTHNIRLVHSVVRRYQGHGVPLDDLIQQGTIGLMRAISKFDPDRGFKLSTYATWWIRQMVQRQCRADDRLIRLPQQAAAQAAQIRAAERKLMNTLGRTPTVAEVAEAAKLPAGKVEQLREVTQLPASLDAIYGDSDAAPGDWWAVADVDTEADAIAGDEVRELVEAMGMLDERSRLVLEMRYALNGHVEHTLDDCAVVFGVTRERIRQIQRGAERQLRAMLTERAAA